MPDEDSIIPVGSVTRLIRAVRRGTDALAAQELFERYIARLEGVARKRLGAISRAVADEEDMAIVAMQRFFEGVRRGRFPDLNDRHDLWHVLLMLVERARVDQQRRELARKRGSGGRNDPITVRQGDGNRSQGGVEGLSATDVRPEDIVATHEMLTGLLSELPDDTFRQIVLLRLELRTNREIAGLLCCVERTVERKLALIRKSWEESLG